MGAILPSKDEIEDVPGRANRREKNVFDKRSKLPGRCGTHKDRLREGRCEDADITMWESLGAQMRVVHRHRLSCALSILLSKAQL